MNFNATMVRARNGVRILQIGNYPPPRCGWSVRTELLVSELRRAGADCQVLNIGPSRRERREGCVDVQNGPDFLWKIVNFGVRRYRFHVHVNGDSPKGFLLALSALTIGRLCGRRPILTFHAGISQRFFPRRGVGPRLLFKILFGLPSTVVCNSEPVRHAIHGYGVSLAKVHAIPAFSRQYVEGIDGNEELPPPVDSFISSCSPVLVCYAAFRPEFMLEQFLRVVARTSRTHPGLGVVLVGHLSGHEPFLQFARDLGIAGRIHLAGDLSHRQFLTALRRADLYVRTHLRDGVSSSVLEAVTLGTPVLAAASESRPPGVVTYPGTDEAELERKLAAMLIERTRAVPPVMPHEDTLGAEVALLLGSAGARNGKGS